MCAHTCVRNPHTCVRYVHTFHHPSCLACLFHVGPLHMRVKLTHTSSTPCTCHHQRLLTHVWAYCPLWLVKNPNSCRVYLASTSLTPHRSWGILALHITFNLSHLLYLFSYKRRALSSFQTSTIYLIVMLLDLWATTSHEQWNHQSLDGFMRFA